MYYGQNNEDKIINDYILEKYGPNYIGTVLEIGANDGITLSNSKFFRDLGWQGFLIEAGKKPFDCLIKNVTENSKCYNIALGSKNCKMKFYESGKHLGEKDSGLVSSLIMDETFRWKSYGVTYEEYEVDCLTWNSFLEKYNLTEQSFNIISIDIEGMDYIVLSQIDLEKVNCDILCVEFNSKQKELFVDYCKKFNMNLIHENGENLIFVK
jgi:FkbM family methyltransferase